MNIYAQVTNAIISSSNVSILLLGKRNLSIYIDNNITNILLLYSILKTLTKKRWKALYIYKQITNRDTFIMNSKHGDVKKLKSLNIYRYWYHKCFASIFNFCYPAWIGMKNFLVYSYKNHKYKSFIINYTHLA